MALSLRVARDLVATPSLEIDWESLPGGLTAEHFY